VSVRLERAAETTVELVTEGRVVIGLAMKC